MRIGVQITKATAFRGVSQEFHNTYHYELETAVTAPAESIVDEIVQHEKFLHSTAVDFKRAAVWSAGSDAGSNAMLFQKNLTGTGSQVHNTSMDRERALLIRWPAGFDVRGNPVYLRKWYHSCGDAEGQSLGSAGILGNTQEIPTATRDLIATRANELRSVGSVSPWELVSPTGRDATGPAQCHKFLEHHQLGDMWR